MKNSKAKKTIDSFNTVRWKLKTGEYHRVDGPAIEWADGTKDWHLNGERHRVDGPAVEYTDGSKAWYLNGKRHRVDGPAIECANGYKAWYINDKKLTFKQWLSEIWDTLSKKEQKKYAFNGFEYEK